MKFSSTLSAICLIATTISATPVAEQHEAREVKEGKCVKGNTHAQWGVCYENYDHQDQNGWVGNCDRIHMCTDNGRWCSISNVSGGSVVCS